MLADLLKQMRTARGLSLRALAQQAGLSHRTLGNWEQGLFQPRLPELEATLAALGASGALKKRALSLMEAPRAIVRLRQEAAQPGRSGTAGQAPQGGDLLRALRMRQGWTLTEVAQGIGVRASTLSRWERGEMWPSAQHLHALCFLLKAEIEEVTALTCGRFWLPVAIEESASPEQWAQHVFDVYNGPVRDLSFLALETRLWRLASRRPFALAQLHTAYAYHARMLMETNRFAEVEAYVERTLHLARQCHGQHEEWAWAIIASAAAQARGARRARPLEAARILADWVGAVHSPINRAWMLSERAAYLAQAGCAEEAVTLSAAACELTATLDRPVEWLFRQRDRADTLVRVGRYREALEALDAAAPLMEVAEDALIRHRLLEAECLLGVDRRSEAQERAHHAQQLIDRYGFDYLKPRAEALAPRL